MQIPAATPVKIDVNDTTRVSGLFQQAPGAKACLILAHSAGAGMKHPFMAAVSSELAGLRIATLRYQFPYMERQSRRPDSPALCGATVRVAVDTAIRLAPGLPLIAGGKSFGGRMTSQAQATAPLPEVRGLAFFGFPLHPPNRPSDERAQHLADVKIPMLFLQGARDEFATLPLLEPVIKQLGDRATLKLTPDADHSFHVPRRTGRTDAEVRMQMLEAFTEWAEALLQGA
jgi:predicted alpha/beta-hydrolase family hydrolase